MNLNKVQLIGRITKDIELKALPNGAKVASFGVATSRTWKSADGNKEEKTEFHNVVAWNRQAEIIAEYLGKGSLIYLEGRNETRMWESDDGKKNYRTEVILESLQLPPKSMNSGSSDEPKKKPYTKPIPKGSSERLERTFGEDPDPIEYPEEDINLEDIPF